MKLTKRAVEAAQFVAHGHEKARHIVWDSDLRGFGLRVYPSGRKVFVVRYRPRGSTRKRIAAIGPFGVWTVENARARARDILHDAAHGKDPLEERRSPDVARLTVAQLADRWLDEYAKQHRKSWKEDERRLTKYVKPKLGRLEAAKVRPADVRALHAKISKSSPVEANRVVSLLTTVYNKASEWELVPPEYRNPASTVDRNKERSRERWLTSAEVKRLGAALDAYPDPYVRAAVRLLLLTGCRKTELLRARWDRLDRDGRRLLLEDTKTGAPKIVPLSTAALTVIDSLPRALHSPWMFPSPRSHGDARENLKRAWASIRKDAKVPDATIHDLRRTVGSWLAQRGVPLKVIGQALGQKDTRSTEIYARIAAQQPAEALEMLGEAFGGILASQGAP